MSRLRADPMKLCISRLRAPPGSDEYTLAEACDRLLLA